jgi:hypothetical protein
METNKQLISETRDDFDDPLAVPVGAGGDDIPAEGWPNEFKPAIVERILSYLPEE